MYLHADVQRLFMHKKKPLPQKIIHRHILLLDIQLWLKVASRHFFLKTIFLKVFFLIINPYQLCFGKWVLLKCDDGLVTLGDAPTLQHNSEAWHNSHLLNLRVKTTHFPQFIPGLNFKLIQSQAVTLTGSFKLRSSCPTADQRSVQRHYVMLLFC